MSDEKPSSYVYCTTNRITQRFYVGSHCGKKRNYLGSGVALKKSLAKYGRHNFYKEILHYCSDHQQEEERLLIALDAANNPQMYNLINNGAGGSAGRIYSEATRKHMQEINGGKNNPFYGRKQTAASKKKTSDAQHRRWARYRNQKETRQN